MRAATRGPDIRIRDAEDDDMAAIAALYAHYVRIGAASFEENPPESAQMARRRAEVLERGLPYVVAETGGTILGFAYAGPFRHRSAYRYTVEDSVYVAPESQGLGAGRKMLNELVERCTRAGYRQMVAVIGDPENNASVAFHAAMGFRSVGTLHSIGFKFERWIDIVIMQRPLGAGAPPDL